MLDSDRQAIEQESSFSQISHHLSQAPSGLWQKLPSTEIHGPTVSRASAYLLYGMMYTHVQSKFHMIDKISQLLWQP